MHDKSAMRAFLVSVLASPVFRGVVSDLADAAIGGPRQPFTREAVQGSVFNRGSGIYSLLGSQRGPLSHYLAARELRSPWDVLGHAVSPDLRACVDAIAGAAADGHHLPDWRDGLVAAFESRLDRLAGYDRRARDLMPADVRLIAGDVPVVSILALVTALRWPHELLPLSLGCGFDIVGSLPSFGGVFPRAAGYVAPLSIDSLDHAADNAKVAQRLSARFRTASADQVADMRKLAAVTAQAVDKGYAFPTTPGELDAMFGPGKWRVLERFCVPQNGDIRACDNAKASLHNSCTVVPDKLICETVDFPGLVAAEFYRAMGPTARCRACADDLEKAYWRLANSQPEFSIIAQFDPDADGGSGAVVYFRVPGHSFGLLSAVTNFNSVAEFTVHVARRCLCVATGHYYDDYCTVDPHAGGDSAKRALTRLMRRLGFPFTEDPKKCIPMRRSVTFVGVVTDLARFFDGIVEYALKPGRAEKIGARITGLLEARVASSAARASLVGKLQFALSALYGHVGRGALRAIIDSDGDASHGTPLWAALSFFLTFLPTLRGRVRRLGPARRRLVLVWSDAMYTRSAAGSEANLSDATGIGFIAYDAFSGSRWCAAGPCASDILAAWRRRTQYIGQLEILGELVPYLSTPERFAGRDVIHFVDNTSAIYSVIKGASTSADSARLVHLISCVLCALDVKVYFEYVPSKENIADAPSRYDFDLVLGLGAERVSLVYPPVAALLDPAAAYSLARSLVSSLAGDAAGGEPSAAPDRVSGGARAARKRARPT